jgi:flagellar motor protein MotB
MKYKFAIFLLVMTQQFSAAQQETYTVTKAPFSSDKYDEYSPVFYKGGIVFSSNRGSGSLVDYSSSSGETTFNINFIDTTKKVTWQKARSFSKSLNTPCNDGPATFNRTRDTIYYSRNLQVEGKFSELSTGRNKLGIFSAVLEGKKWTKIRELRFNNEWYNVTTPWLSPDGKRLYFASDKPDGYGGSDLYYCEWKNDYWTDPVNLGPVINTKGNEAYPFVTPAGEILFASDGHPGLGGKDIFFSRMKGTEWLPPVRLDPPVNSQYDDFGIITDSLMSEGYFSSKRNKSVNIFRFKTNFPQIFYTDIQKENQYCFRFSDSGAIEIDTLNLRYRWDFGDSKKSWGKVANHCYPGPGDYKVRLDIVDRATGNLFFTKLVYTLELRDFEQPYINSPDVAIAGELISFDGLKSYMPGYEILSYSWDFGEGARKEGTSVNHTFKVKGEYNVNLGLTLKSKTTGIINKTGVTRKITVLNDNQERTAYLTKKASVKRVLPDIRRFNNAHIETEYSAEEDFQKDALFRIILLSSKSRIGLSSSVFRNLPDKYALKEVSESESGVYSYIADEQMNLMSTYPAFRELSGLGFRDVQIKLSVIKDPVERELLIIKKNYGILSDNYFDSYGQLKSSAYLMLDQIVILMNRNPNIKLEIGVHTDNLGIPANNLTISQTRARVMVNYLINRGINGNRLIAKGYGGVKPVASNIYEKDRKLNRRVDFRLIN